MNMIPPLRITIYLWQSVSMAGSDNALLTSRSTHIVIGINIIINLSILVNIIRYVKLDSSEIWPRFTSINQQ